MFVHPAILAGMAKTMAERQVLVLRQCFLPKHITFLLNEKEFQKILDETLQSLNSDYEAKRFNNMTLNPLIVNIAKPGLFYDWLKDQDKLGGQHKIPRLSNQREYLEQLKNRQRLVK
jgi:hypothetical protein